VRGPVRGRRQGERVSCLRKRRSWEGMVSESAPALPDVYLQDTDDGLVWSGGRGRDGVVDGHVEGYAGVDEE
jgi:hypothetical protein